MCKQPQRVGLWLFVSVLALTGVTLGLIQPDRLFAITGEEEPLPQAKALTDLAGDFLRPRPDTADDIPVAYAGVNPFGVNVFLEQEVEPAKREQAVRMAAEAGFHWLRQEFPWEDIEIHGKGDFEDRRHQPYRSAWEKYDQIVDLAERCGMELIVRLSNPPAWTRAKGDTAGTFAPPDNYEDFGDFVAAVVSRYRGRIRYYQIWNEPNIYPEWGERPVSPEEYVELLKIAYTRAKAVDSEVVIISGALASTIELGPRDMNDFIFLQRMYDAGAAPYFDILAMQGYGLWSAPTDRRLHPRVVNFSRPLLMRDLMVKNGDAHKAIWISEMNWNAIPEDHPAPPIYGRYTKEEQARYLVLAYERIQREWPWLGVANVWFLKRATDDWERSPDHPEAFFRLLDADFTPLPAYEAIRNYTSRLQPTLYPGAHPATHWALSYRGAWEASPLPTGGHIYWTRDPSARLRFRFEGTGVMLLVPIGREFSGAMVSIDGGPAYLASAEGSAVKDGYIQIWLARRLESGMHELELWPADGPLSVGGVRVVDDRRIEDWLMEIGR
ncbi:MAG: cellulase family glycosylhydrolase [Anaerolineae bacterium]|nr:cellulase family glycosylhydrolase [Anaerolineae bacterium]MDW8099528.1 cellulase family glycosylhydrolase [Anaerolineae bacterium]